MPNRLADESSPYLLQHKDNPVDWYPWGEEALTRAQREDKPILLSVGYSACHWCHVMAHESFENAEIARQMNDSFVCIKVDREERPDVDDLYMEAVQAMTGGGGWPLTAFLDPEGVPFHGGTYFPPEPRQGMPSFPQVLDAVIDAYRNRRDEINSASENVREGLGAVGRLEASGDAVGPETLGRAAEGMRANSDAQNGGFGGAPKFPPASALEFLMMRGPVRQTERGATGPLTHVQLTLDKMAGGRIYDQVGGGFARYATDASWLVPHFEKMLYDNALLARSYLHGFQLLGHERYERVCRETLDFMLRELTGPEGGFYSALDADSEGEEGKFYVWEEDEMHEALEQTDLAEASIERILGFWGVSPSGNFEGRNVLHVVAGPGTAPPPGLEEARGGCSPTVTSGSGPASTTSASARGTRSRSPPSPRPARCSATSAISTRPAPAPLSSTRRCATRRGACCGPTRTTGPGSRPTSRTTPSCSRRCSPSMRRRSRSAGSRSPARPRTR